MHIILFPDVDLWFSNRSDYDEFQIVHSYLGSQVTDLVAKVDDGDDDNDDDNGGGDDYNDDDDDTDDDDDDDDDDACRTDSSYWAHPNPSSDSIQFL